MDLPSLAVTGLIGLALATLAWVASVRRSPGLTSRAKAAWALAGWLILVLCGAGVWAVAQSQITR